MLLEFRGVGNLCFEEDGVRWDTATPSAVFSARRHHQVVAYDNQLWMIGGFDGANKSDVWRSEDGVDWRQGFNDVFQFR